jgi:hypothetical protein
LLSNAGKVLVADTGAPLSELFGGYSSNTDDGSALSHHAYSAGIAVATGKEQQTSDNALSLPEDAGIGEGACDIQQLMLLLDHVSVCFWLLAGICKARL